MPKINKKKPKKKTFSPKRIKKVQKSKNNKKKVIKKRKSKKNIISETKVLDLSHIVPVSPIIPVKKKTPRKHRSKNPSVSKMYFTQSTEDAIIRYNTTENKELREIIFNDHIKYPFEKLVENVFNTFKFTYLETGPLDAQKETVSHLVANIGKFNPMMGFKAYSYFSIVAKNYLIALNNNNYKRFNQHIDIGEERDNHTVQLQFEDKHHKNKETSEFMKLMVRFWENNVNKIFTKPRDLNIANAVIELFRNSDRIDAYNKKALYLYIREISLCKTQQITRVIKKMKQYQKQISQSYRDHGVVAE